jgi:hypothetical protein
MRLKVGVLHVFVVCCTYAVMHGFQSSTTRGLRGTKLEVTGSAGTNSARSI